jgi:heat shock protein HslJ
MRRITLLSILSLAAVACLGNDFADSVEGPWQMTSGTVDGEAIPVLETHPITITFEEDQMSGTAACNGYGGTYELSGSTITFSGLAMTGMGCSPEESMQAEAMFTDAITRVDTVAVDGDLTLSGDGVAMTFEALEPVRDADLTNTVWVLESLVDGDSVSSVAGERATLEFFTDGSTLGGTGCRTFTGRYVIVGAEVEMPELAAHGPDCPADLSDQDSQVFTVLGDGFRVSVDGRTLTVSDPEGVGLTYQAET